jgi:hypothetical protein
VAYKLAGIDIRNGYDILFLKIILYGFGSAFTAVSDIVIFTNQACYLYMIRLYLIGLDTIITDVRIGNSGYLNRPWPW